MDPQVVISVLVYIIAAACAYKLGRMVEHHRMEEFLTGMVRYNMSTLQELHDEMVKAEKQLD